MLRAIRRPRLRACTSLLRSLLPVAARLGLLAAMLGADVSGQSFTVSGRFQYIDKAWSFSGWTGEDPALPIRRADVHVLDAATQTVLGAGFTSQDGSFAIVCVAGGAVDVLVRCDADTGLDARSNARQPLRVTTEADVEYSAFSPVFAGHVPPAPLDIGTVTAQPILSGNDEANPFNLLDVGVAAFDYILGPQVGGLPVPTETDTTLRVIWPSSFGSLAFQKDAYIAPDDGYDDAVILHELGHVVCRLYSADHNPGGTHSFGDSDEDPRLAYSEGYATFFAGCVLDSLGREGLYVDCTGGGQSGGVQLRMRLETANPFQNDAFGESDEVAVACTLFDLIDDEHSTDNSPGVDDDPFDSTMLIEGQGPQRAWWQTFVGPLKSALFVNVTHAWDAWFATHAGDPHTADVRAVFDRRRLVFWPDAQEPDDSRTHAVPTPATSAGTWTTDRTRYASRADPPVPGAGDEDWYALDLVAGSIVNIETRYPGDAADADTQCDTFLYVFAPDGTAALTTDGGGKGRNAAAMNLVVSQTGTWHYKVATQSSVRRYGRYDVRAVYVLENHAPTIAAGPTASPGTIDDDQLATLSAAASDPDAGQALGYAWTPLGGGSIVGSGASVGFDPPAVTASTLFPVQLVVADELGAATAPLVVAVRVEPASGSRCASPAAVESVGSGKPGLLGTPLLSARNLPVVPSSDFALEAAGCHPGLAALLVAGFSLVAAPFDGGTLYPSPDVLRPVALTAQGTLHLPIGLPSAPGLCGLTLHCQLIVPGDPGADGGQKTAQSNSLTLRFGH